VRGWLFDVFLGLSDVEEAGIYGIKLASLFFVVVYRFISHV
jgi:hypothetical protein